MPNIFLSHCSEDKGVIDSIAQKLLNHFGQCEIFYDAWSMQPGDNFLDGMEKGLKDCEYFFLFMSQTSINKPMVRLEWHAALLKHLKGDTRFVPVRMDNISSPALLTSTLYIDMYNRGINQTVEDIALIAKGASTYNPAAIPQFKNLTVNVSKMDNRVMIDVLAKRLAEPDNYFAFWTSDGSEPSIINGMAHTNSGELGDGRKVYVIQQNHTITPNRPNNYALEPLRFPVEIEVFHVLGDQIVSLFRGVVA